MNFTTQPFNLSDDLAFMMPLSEPTQHTNLTTGLKRKMSFSSNGPTCDVCSHVDPILSAKECGHTFHSRCVPSWPAYQCPVCDVSIEKLSIVNVDLEAKPEPRSGKWTKEEEDFVNLILNEIDTLAMPLANGTPVRLFLAKLLNCSPMRLSKKFQKNALGKRTYRVPKGLRHNGKLYRVLKDKTAHRADMIRFSKFEQIFRIHMVLMRKNDSTRFDGSQDLYDVSVAVRQFWAHSFIKFSMVIGQAIEGIDLSTTKKKKAAMQKMRDGKHNQLFLWNSNIATVGMNGPASMPTYLNHNAPTPNAGIWKPLGNEYSWPPQKMAKTCYQQADKFSAFVPITPTALLKSNSLDENVSNLFGMDMDHSLEAELLGLGSIEPVDLKKNESTNIDKLMLDELFSSAEPALQTWANITLA